MDSGALQCTRVWGGREDWVWGRNLPRKKGKNEEEKGQVDNGKINGTCAFKFQAESETRLAGLRRV